MIVLPTVRRIVTIMCLAHCTWQLNCMCMCVVLLLLQVASLDLH
jgi:hypothetical protein